MSKNGVDVFDHTLQKTNQWINEINEILGWSDKQKGYLALRCTLQALRDRLPFETVVNFGAQLPMLIRGFYYEGWKPGETPIKIKSPEEFMEFVTSHALNSNLEKNTDMLEMVRAVFEVVSRHISPGERDHVLKTLPPGLGRLWGAP